jgi:hypothetical protein
LLRDGAGIVSAGYSGTPLAKKLGVKEGGTLALVAAPDGWSVPDLPPGVTTKTSLRGHFDVAIAFVRSAAELRRRAETIVRSTPDASSVWIAWPRKAGGHDSDVTENLLRETLLPSGLVDVKVAALDEDWSGLKFMWRKESRAKR